MIPLRLGEDVNTLVSPQTFKFGSCSGTSKVLTPAKDIAMFVFSVNARTPKAIEDFAKGSEVPFIVYINFKDLFGAELLCRSYLLHQGFEKPNIEKRKLIEERFLINEKLIAADPALKEALDSGYSIQVFSAH